MRHIYSIGYIGCIVLLLLLTACDDSARHVALGTLERDRIAHTATANEVVVALPQAQGSVVHRGDVLVRLDDTMQRARVARAEAEVALTQARLTRLRNGARAEDVAAARARVVAQRAAVVDSSSDYARKLALYQRQVISKSELDKVLARRDSDNALLRSAREALLKLTNGSREEDLQAATAQLRAAQAGCAVEKKRLADLTIRATRDGILDDLPWNLGERVTVGSPVAVVFAGVAPYARIYVPEPYRAGIRVGDKLPVHVDGVPAPISGTVRWISSEAAFTPYYALNQEERAHLMYLAEVQLPAGAAALPNGLPAQVDLQ